MKRKTLIPTLVTLVVLLGVTGITVLAARNNFQSILPQLTDASTSISSLADENSPDYQQEAAATDGTSSATTDPSALPSGLDVVSSATQQSSDQPAGPDATSSATPRSSEQSAGPDATSSATPKSSGQTTGPDVVSSATPQSSDDDDEEDDEDDRDEDDRSDDYANQFIGADQAKSIAIAHVGNGAIIKSIELEDDYPPVYKIDVLIGEKEIELKIHAVTGALLEESREDDD